MSRLVHGASLAVLAALLSPAAARAEDEGAIPSVSAVEVVGVRSKADTNALPVTAEGVTADQIANSVNVTNVEDALKYLPDVLVRKRHIGDVQSPVSTRTSGVGASARSLIYADDVLLSALIGNNNASASPRWSMVSPEQIARIDVLYGPFAAEYPGNSVGAVINITTREPERFEATARVEAVDQAFAQYGTNQDNRSGRAAFSLGDRRGPLSLWLNLNHTDSTGQPLTYVTAARPASPGAAGAPVTGAFADTNRTGAAIAVLGASGIEHQVQDNANLKLGWALTPTLKATWTLGLFAHEDRARAESYLRDAGGAPAYSGALNIGGFAYTVAPSAFSGGVYHLDEQHWAQSLGLKSHGGGVFDWEAVATAYDFTRDRQRTPSGALPAANAGGAGTISDLAGTGWRTFDARGAWRPQGAQAFSFGVHLDQFRLNNPKYATGDWMEGAPGTLTSLARGRTRTEGLWAQDVWTLGPDLTLTLGARYERWRAFDGFNYSLLPALAATQPELNASGWSPKATLAWRASERWRLKASYGEALRFPTVSELYQAITTGAVLTTPNPNLRPEHARSGELTAERITTRSRLRLSLFEEDLNDALLSQSAPLVTGSSTLFSFVQNVERVRSRGAEVVASREDVLVPGLSLSGWVTYVDGRTLRDAAFPAAVGKHTPQVPRWRGGAMATWQADSATSLSLAARYSDPSFGTLDNSDRRSNTYQGFGGFLVADAHLKREIGHGWALSGGVDNLFNRKYFVFHPFPQRTVLVELKYGGW